MADAKRPVTRLCRYDDKRMFIREHDVSDLMGKVGFTDVIILDILGRFPTPAERTIVDAVFVALIEHGLSPSAIAARMAIMSAPESLQGAVCAGLQSVGSVLVGSLENCAALLAEIVAADDADAAGRRVAERYKAERRPIPGFGHPHFKPVDPRTVRLFELVEELNLPGRHRRAAEALSRAVDAVYGKHLTMNASMGMAVALSEIGFPPAIMRGLAVICRAAGLVAHIHEEMNDPAGWTVMRAAGEAVPYDAG